MEKVRKRRIKLGALAMASVLMVIPLCGCKKDKKETVIDSIITQEELYKTFKPGEHMISVKVLEDLRKKIYQHQYYEGYKVVGIANFTAGRNGDIYKGTIITYINIKEVKCIVTGKDETGLKYEMFGMPIIEKDNKYNDGNIFNEGEHILTVPFEMESTKDLPNLEYHEGYECVGLEFNNYGDFSAYVDNGYALYVNTVPVECNDIKIDGNDIEFIFGKPIEEVKKLTLK